MPPVVRECLQSWIRQNPDWDVVFVDSRNVWDYLDRGAIPVARLMATSPQVYANAIRLCLLDAHGGVWADATTFCRTPLSEWLTPPPGGFFAFSAPGADRMLSNWFIASTKGHYLIQVMTREYIGILERVGPLTVFSHAMVDDILARAETTDVFFDPLLLDTLHGYPYFLFHYLFARLYRSDEKFKQAWDATRKISAHPSHAAQSLDLRAPTDGAARETLRAANPLVHKLDWRIGGIEPGALLCDILTGVV